MEGAPEGEAMAETSCCEHLVAALPDRYRCPVFALLGLLLLLPVQLLILLLCTGHQRSVAQVVCAVVWVLGVCSDLLVSCRGLPWGCPATRARAPRPAKPMATTDIDRHCPVTRDASGQTCIVCLSQVEAGQPCRRMQCGHEFHMDCIAEWWLHGPRGALSCPLCRFRQPLAGAAGGGRAAAEAPWRTSAEYSV